MEERRPSLRQFRCPEELWREIESAASDRELATDALIVAALREFLQPCRPAASSPGPCLSIAYEPDDDILPSQTLVVSCGGVDHVVRARRFLIGRDPDCDLVLQGPGVGSEHALLEVVRGAHYLVDLGARLGISCNGQRIDRKRVVDGDQIGLGGHRLLLRLR
jgi:hypothetical protein